MQHKNSQRENSMEIQGMKIKLIQGRTTLIGY